MKRRHLLGSVAALAPRTVCRRGAQTFPDKPIRFVVPYAPGGATDTSARIAAEYLSSKFGQQVLVDNKPGGGTIIATEIVAKAKPDRLHDPHGGGSRCHQYVVRPETALDPVKDLAPSAAMSTWPLLLACNPNAPYKTMAEFIAWAKTQSSPIPYASAGNASMPHLWGEQLRMETGIKLEHIGYKGSADALKDVLGGHVHAVLRHAAPGRPRGEGRQVARAGRRSRKARADAGPDVPTVAEAGLPANLTGAVFFGVMAPGGTPEPIVAALNAAFNELLRDPATSRSSSTSASSWSVAAPPTTGSASPPRRRSGARSSRRRTSRRQRDGRAKLGRHAQVGYDLGDPPRKQKMLPVLFAQMWLRPSGASSCSTTLGGTCTQRPSSRATQVPSSFW